MFLVLRERCRLDLAAGLLLKIRDHRLGSSPSQVKMLNSPEDERALFTYHGATVATVAATAVPRTITRRVNAVAASKVDVVEFASRFLVICQAPLAVPNL
jgi:hypothetical protein